MCKCVNLDFSEVLGCSVECEGAVCSLGCPISSVFCDIGSLKSAVWILDCGKTEEQCVKIICDFMINK